MAYLSEGKPKPALYDRVKGKQAFSYELHHGILGGEVFYNSHRYYIILKDNGDEVEIEEGRVECDQS